MIICSICNISVKKRYLSNHYRSNTHKNNALRSHCNLSNVTIIESAFGKRIQTYRITSLAESKDLETVETFVNSIKDDLKTLLDNHIHLKTFKVNFILCANFVHQNKNLHNVFDFQTENYILNESHELRVFFDSLKETLSHKVSEFEKKDSGWSLKDIISLDMNINRFNPLRGSSFIELPYDIKAKKAVINVKNADLQCFKWALLSALYPQPNNYCNRVTVYMRYENQLNFTGISFPVKLVDIHKVERLNDISINVFSLEYNANTKTHQVIGPVYFTKARKSTHINLLYITNGNNGHYCYIKNLSRLVSKQITSRNGAIHICDGCLLYFPTRIALQTHQIHDCAHIYTLLPSSSTFRKNWFNENVSNDKLYFDNFEKKKRVPFIIYADTEAFLKPITSCSNDPNKSSTTNVQRHDVYSFGYYIKCSYDSNLSKYVTYSGENCCHMFMTKLEEDIKMICRKNSFQTAPLPLTVENKKHIEETKVCYICKKDLLDPFIDYDWYTGVFLGVSHETCSKKFHKINFIPIVLHNLSNYDAHFIVHALNFADGEIQIIPQNKEKYISFSKILNINGQRISLRFIDSLKFLSSSLDSLALNLSDNQFVELKNEFPNDNDFELLKRKGVFPYEFMKSFDSLKYSSLPQINDFFSSLTGSTISNEDYAHAQRVWSHFKCSNMSDYSNLYLKTDVLLLSDIFENFRSVCLETYDLDPAHYYTSPGLSWDAMLKFTEVEIDLLTDFDKIAFIKSGIRGGISQCSNRYAKANNPYMDNYQSNEPISYLTYLDANNLYGWAMSQYLPISQFEWVNIDVNFNIPITSEFGYILEVDLEYPDDLHDIHSDLPLCPENICIGGSKEPKLVPTLYNKNKYVLHYRNLLQSIELGLKVTKVHRVLKFKQSPWLKKYIDLNTQLRTLATSDFEKDFYKLMNNSIFGKTMENIEKRVNVKLLTHWENQGKIKGASDLIAKPEFHSLSVFSESLVAIQLKKTKLLYNKPIFLGFSILDISKTLMYDFHYNYMKCKFEKIKLLYTDTDSLVYQIYCTDFYEEIRSDLSNYFDTSDYERNNTYGFPLLNKKKIGYFKDEHNGQIFSEFVGLRSKMYAMQVNNKTTTKAKGVNKCVTRKLKLDNYKTCLFTNKIELAEMYRFRSIKHVIFTQKINKICLSYNDTKRFIIPNSTDTLAWVIISNVNLLIIRF